MVGGYFWISSQGATRGRVLRVRPPLGIKYNIDERGNVAKLCGATVKDGAAMERDGTSNFTCFPQTNCSIDGDCDAALYGWCPLTLKYCNCKNVEVVQVLPEPRLNKARIKRGKQPIGSYKVVNVLPLASKARSRRYETASHSEQRFEVSIRRGHFACYGKGFGHWEVRDGAREWVEAGKLFGKLCVCRRILLQCHLRQV